MARPKKQLHEQRSASIRSDLTVAEKEYVQQQARAAGLSEAEYTRRRVLDYVVPPATGSRQVDPALVSELNRVGVNVNQLAKAVHSDRAFVQYWKEIGGDLSRVLEKVVRAYDS